MTQPADERGALDTAWQIHGTLVDWTGKVDAKASFALSIESAVLAGIVALSGSGHRLHALPGGWPTFLYWFGTGLLALGVLTAVTVVVPRLRGRQMKAEAAGNFIYFGHLRHWKPAELQDALKHSEVLPVLSRQLVVMSQIAWMKHIRAQASMALAVLGTGIVAAAALVC